MSDDRKIAVVQANFDCYVRKDRAALERLLTDDFHFTSPLDNRLDRDAYFTICWPNSRNILRFDYVRCLVQGATVIVTYEGHTSDGNTFRNTEVMTLRADQIAEVEVYFGWSVPHRMAPGTHGDP